MPFDPQPDLLGPTLRMRPLRRDDLDALHRAGSDPATWAGHPARERWRRDVFEGYFTLLLDSGGALVAIDRASDTVIGCSRYYVPPDHPDAIAIGFTFLDHRVWGGPANRAMKALMLGHAFLSFPAVWFHIDPTNVRSQKATAKLGAVLTGEESLDLAGTGTPARWMCFRLGREQWSGTAT